MKVYLAGPMRGYDKSNFPAFRQATAELRAAGYEVFSPAEWDIEHGFTEDGEPPEGWNLREFFLADLANICIEAEAVVLLPQWWSSLGTAAEIATARALELPVMTLKEALEAA